MLGWFMAWGVPGEMPQLVPWSPARSDIHRPVLPSSFGALLRFAPVLPEHLPGSTFPQQEGLMEKVLCFKTL